ncbi:hypothetical protein JQK62_19085 [Leptospira santarosai]|nr:hypothetical protein [Leptospira santarosai]
MVTLKPIDSGNWEKAIQLTVNEEQKEYVATNLYSIAQLQFLENFSAMGVYLDNQMVVCRCMASILMIKIIGFTD